MSTPKTNKTNSNLKQLKSSLLLLLAAIVWGAAFVAQSVAGESIGTFTFNGIRFIIGGICLLPFIRKQGTRLTAISRQKLLGGVLCGTALFLASTAQQAGIAMGAEAGEAGFLTACYIVLVPIIGIFIGRKCSGLIWLAVGITLAGLYLLCFQSFPGNGLFAMSGANIMLLLCALLFSVQILAIDHYAPIMSPVSLACVQFFVSGVLSCLMAVFAEVIPDPSGWAASLSVLSAWIPILYTGIFSSAVGYTLQAVGQRDLNPTLASLIMSMESVFSTLFGWLILGQTMTARELLGCALIFTAIILAQVPLPQNDKRITDN